jgi:transposase-like protein
MAGNINYSQKDFFSEVLEGVPVMGEAEFLELASATLMKPETVKRVREVLVESVSIADVASRYGVTRQAIENGVNRIIEERSRRDSIPENWVNIMITVPEEIKSTIEAIESQARKKAGLVLKSKKAVMSADVVELLSLVISQATVK